jgi:hypothetical protein
MEWVLYSNAYSLGSDDQTETVWKLIYVQALLQFHGPVPVQKAEPLHLVRTQQDAEEDISSLISQ